MSRLVYSILNSNQVFEATDCFAETMLDRRLEYGTTDRFL
jgi:hypothetical protein